MSHLSVRLGVTFALCLPAFVAAPHAASAQAAPPFGLGQFPTAAVQIRFQIGDVSAGQLAGAEREARSLQPALPADLDTPLQTGLSGLPEIWLHYELGKTSPPAAFVEGPSMIVYDGFPSTLGTGIVPHGYNFASAIAYTTTETVHIQPDNKVTVTLLWKRTVPASVDAPKGTTDTFAVTCTVPCGQPTVVALPTALGQPERLVFLTATLEPALTLPAPGHGMNADPNIGADPNGMDRMQTHSPDIQDRINILPPPMPSPVIIPGSN